MQKKTVDGAIAEYNILLVVKRLAALDDGITESTAGLKVYPGLVGHVVPTNPFRNDFEIRPPSPYIARRLEESKEKRSDEDLQGLMRDLLEIPKAQGFASWIWEPMLTKKFGVDDASISIVGSQLPVSSDGLSVFPLLRVNASEIDFITFESMAEFGQKAQDHVKNKSGDFCVFAKATNDSFAAIDAIIVFRTEARFVIAALQLTVAENYHSVLQSMIIEFINTCRGI